MRNLGPVFALLTMPWGPNGSNVPASYVKWLESAGARVRPLAYHASDETVDKVFNATNGALFPGGADSVSPAARRIFHNALSAAKRDDPYPIWATCDGFEWVMQIAAEDDSVLTSGFNSENISLPLNFTRTAKDSKFVSEAKTSYVFNQGLTVFEALSSLPITMNAHHQGVTPVDFFSRPKLASTFHVLATNVDLSGREFISLVEAKGGIPIWASQFHPEKSIFEQGMQLPSGLPYERISHTRAAISAAQFMANFIVDKARLLSRHRYESASNVASSLIYNYNASTITAPEFLQTYFFRDSDLEPK